MRRHTAHHPSAARAVRPSSALWSSLGSTPALRAPSTHPLAVQFRPPRPAAVPGARRPGKARPPAGRPSLTPQRGLPRPAPLGEAISDPSPAMSCVRRSWSRPVRRRRRVSCDAARPQRGAQELWLLAQPAHRCSPPFPLQPPPCGPPSRPAGSARRGAAVLTQRPRRAAPWWLAEPSGTLGQPSRRRAGDPVEQRKVDGRVANQAGARRGPSAVCEKRGCRGWKRVKLSTRRLESGSLVGLVNNLLAGYRWSR